MKDPLLISKKTTFHQIWWRSDQKWIFNTFNNPLKLNVSSVQWSMVTEVKVISLMNSYDLYL